MSPAPGRRAGAANLQACTFRSPAGDLVALKRFLMNARLSRTEREAKRLHGLQKRVRNQLEELEDEKRRGKVTEAAYKDRKAKLDTHRHELVEKLKHVEEQVRHLRAELAAVDRASA